MRTAEKRRTGRKSRATELPSYRVPMMVRELKVSWKGDGYYVCPQCHATLEREFCAYCDRCGQCLNWRRYKEAKRIQIRWDGGKE